MTLYRSDSAMDNPINWSLRVGRVFDIDIRLHIIFLLWVGFQLIRDVVDASKLAGPAWIMLLWSAGPTLILFLSVLLHEFGHCFGSRAAGGEAHEILLWPLGGLAFVQPPDTPRGHFVTVVCGPLVNVAICTVVGAILMLAHGAIGMLPLNPVHPYTPLDPALMPASSLWQMLLVVFGINYILLLFNVLLPFYPMDGGQLVHVMLWKRKGLRAATLLAATIGMCGAAAFGVVALLTSEVRLLCLGVFGYLNCYQRRQWAKEEAMAGNEFGYDFSRGYQTFDKPEGGRGKPGFFSRRRAARRAKALQRERLDAQRRDEEFDRILAKISSDGISALTAKERRFLEGETRRRK